jgi:hypothetical protein
VNDGIVTFSHLNFGVPGALLNLSGTYNLDSGGLDHHGKLMLRTKLSQTTTGVKSFFLKALDPFFKGKDAVPYCRSRLQEQKTIPRSGSIMWTAQRRAKRHLQSLANASCWAQVRLVHALPQLESI